MTEFLNPFRPGAGHQPPYLSGRDTEKDAFLKLLEQGTILENMVLTGLRGVGKTVLLESFKPLAMARGWAWVGTDLSESSSLREEHIAIRLCTDLSPITSSIVVSTQVARGAGFQADETLVEQTLDYRALTGMYSETPGLVLDKLKAVLETAWQSLSKIRASNRATFRGVVFAYDEAQNLADHADRDEYPLSLLLDTFQSLQRKGLPLMLVLTGLPTLFPKLVQARTFTERMFRTVELQSLSPTDSRDAILRPIRDTQGAVQLSSQSVDTIIEMSAGYPYFIQFICKEVYDAFIQRLDRGKEASVPTAEIEQKLDRDFFSGRWARTTDRQRELMSVIASLQSQEGEFTVQEIVEKSREMQTRPFSSSHTNQMLAALSEQGLVFKNRHGRYSFAVPLLGPYILRQMG